MNWLIISQTAIALFSFLSVIVSSFNSQKITRIRLEINGRMDQLLKTEKGLAHAEGYIAGKKKISRNEKQTQSK